MIRNLAAAVAAMVIAGTVLSAQRPGRTPDGHPDLQGTWLNNTATPLERPKEAAGRTSFTDAEARDYVQRYQLDRTAALTRDDPRFELDVAGDLDTYEPGPLLPGNRTAIITEPADGRIPALTPEAQKRLTDRTAHLNAHYAENPEDFPNAERCLVVANTSSPPMMPAFYNNGLQIVQAGNYVMILSEMIHDARIIALDRRTASAGGPRAVERRLDRALGGRHAGRGHDQLHDQDGISRFRNGAARRRALHAERRRYAEVSVHRR